MTKINKEKITTLLTNAGIAAASISNILIRDEKIGVVLAMSDDGDALRTLAEETLQQAGYEHVTVVLTAENEPPQAGRPAPPTPKPLPNIRHVIAVASGKGGVGKSTIAANLAAALSQAGNKVGLLDADIYGPSIAHMFGVTHKPDAQGARLQPNEAHGIKVLSMGAMVDGDAAIIWRGPMVSKALQQMLFSADWGNLDYLVLDLPPGTGDIHLSLAQRVELSGVVMVSTPQQVAQLDVKKAIQMFDKVGIPVLGLVDNMRYFVDAESGNRSYPFGQSNPEALSKEYKLRLLASLPLEPALAEHADAGTPLVLAEPKNATAQLITGIAEQIESELADKKG